MRILRQKVDPVKAALARETHKTMTSAEQALWQQLRANHLDGCHFRRQQLIAGFIVDFYCHAASLVIEVDGPVHENQQDEDAERTRILENHGLHIIRFTNDEVDDNLADVLEHIRHIIEKLKSAPPLA